MEKRIKLPTPVKSTVENVKKQDLGRGPSNSKILSALKEKPAKRHPKEMNEINAKRTLSSLEEQEKPLRKLRNKAFAKTIRTRMRQNNDENSSSKSDDEKTQEDAHDKKTKKLKNNKSEGKTVNFQSQDEEAEAQLELTDEETQTSKAEENNPNRTSGTRMTPNMMDQFGLSEQLFEQQNVLGQVFNSNLSPEKSSKNEKPAKELVPNLGTATASIQKGKEKDEENQIENQSRQGHFRDGDKPLRIVKTEYDEKISDVIFTMDWKKAEQNNFRPAASKITREELLKYDPLLLVYYYEKHLEFTQYRGEADFDLEKIPH